MLFRLVQNPKLNCHQMLAYEWIEVLAIDPFALGKPDENWGEWCQATISTMYVCRTSHGLIQIGSDDIWEAIRMGEYIEDQTNA